MLIASIIFTITINAISRSSQEPEVTFTPATSIKSTIENGSQELSLLTKKPKVTVKSTMTAEPSVKPMVELEVSTKPTIKPISTDSPIDVKSVKINEKNNKQTINLKVGQKLILSLESNISTGYSWEYATNLDKKILIELNHQYVEEETNLGGVPGNEIWTYEAKSSGETSIELNYLRTWDPDSIADTYTVKVVSKK